MNCAYLKDIVSDMILFGFKDIIVQIHWKSCERSIEYKCIAYSS